MQLGSNVLLVFHIVILLLWSHDVDFQMECLGLPESTKEIDDYQGKGHQPLKIKKSDLQCFLKKRLGSSCDEDENVEESILEHEEYDKMHHDVFGNYHKLEVENSNEIMKWPFQGINFMFDKSIDGDKYNYSFKKVTAKAKIRKALSEIQSKTCLTFNQTPKFTKNNLIVFAQIFNSDFSLLGYDLDFNFINLIKDSENLLLGTIVHEIFHTLGIEHTHMRSDRDDFVHYMPENTERAFRKQFEISTRTFDSSEPGQGSESVPYDYSSVMHYPAVAFSKNGLPTILPTNQKYERTLGQNAGPSFLDILNINRIYCDNKASVQGLWSKINSYCENDGYLDPKSKKRCICRDGFYGDKCQHIGSTKCGEKILLDDQVTEKRISFYSFVDDNSDTSCVWLIHNLSSDRKIIKIVSTDFEVPSTSANYCNLSWFEIRSDKPNDFESTSLTHLGARYCGEERHRINVLSREEKVMMLLQSSQDFGIVKLDLIVKII